jgi:DNA-directed RNA polymerase specialized sigma24 family protein
VGYITNQWIKIVEGINRRSHALAHVKLAAARPTSRFSEEHGLVIRLVAEKEHSREQHVVHFIERSLQEVGPELRAELVSRMLGGMSDEELVLALNGEVTKRLPQKAAE